MQKTQEQFSVYLLHEAHGWRVVESNAGAIYILNAQAFVFFM